MSPTKIAQQIARNVADVDAGLISWDEFHARQLSAWKQADRGEPCIVGSACERRVRAVQAELKKIP